MGAADLTTKLMKSIHEREISEMLRFAEFLLAKLDREKAEEWSALHKFAGRYDGANWRREELHDRASFVDSNVVA